MSDPSDFLLIEADDGRQALVQQVGDVRLSVEFDGAAVAQTTPLQLSQDEAAEACEKMASHKLVFDTMREKLTFKRMTKQKNTASSNSKPTEKP